MNASFDQPVGALDELVTPCQRSLKHAFFWTFVIFIGFKLVTKTRDPFGCNLDLPVDPGETKITPEPPDSYTAYIYTARSTGPSLAKAIQRCCMESPSRGAHVSSTSGMLGAQPKIQ